MYDMIVYFIYIILTFIIYYLLTIDFEMPVKDKVKIAIIGINGKMGQMLVKKLKNEFEVLGIDIIKTPYNASNSDDILNNDIKLVIDFSNPSYSYNIIKKALIKRIPVISGTTNFSNQEIATLKYIAKKKHISLIINPNYSTGINNMLKTIPLINTTDWQISLIETHHLSKKDAPSGTSRLLARELNVELQNITSIRNDNHTHIQEIVFFREYEEVKCCFIVKDRLAYFNLIYQDIKRIIK